MVVAEEKDFVFEGIVGEEVVGADIVMTAGHAESVEQLCAAVAPEN